MEENELLSGAVAPEGDAAPEAEGHEDVRSAVRAALDKARSEAGAETEGAELKDGRSRDERGRFAPKEGEQQAPDPTKGNQPKEGEKAAQRPPQGQEEPLQIRPPVGWSAAAKAQFNRLPPEVQESVARREQEINKGFAVLSDYKGLDEFTPLIKASNTTHAEVMRRAIDWERSLKTNPVGTVLHVAKIAGVDLRQLVGMQGQAPQQQQQQRPPQGQTQMGLDPRQVEQLVQRTVAEREAMAEVNRFMSDPANVHAEAVAEHMAALISSGQAKDLQDAYDKATWANPEIRATLINQQRTNAAVNGANKNRQIVNQARSAAKAVTGAPSGRQPTNQQADPKSVRDAIRAAVAAQRDA
jgi:hypothetical protein